MSFSDHKRAFDEAVIRFLAEGTHREALRIEHDYPGAEADVSVGLAEGDQTIVSLRVAMPSGASVVDTIFLTETSAALGRKVRRKLDAAKG
jgi:hypothetical protein